MESNNQDAENLVELRDRLRERVKVLRQQLDEAERQLSSVTVAMELLGYKGASPIDDSIRSIEPASLKGLTQEQALVRIAKSNNGKFLVAVAKRLLLAAGLIKNPKNANNIIYNVIARSGKFNRLNAGEYGLIESANKNVLIVSQVPASMIKPG